MKKILVTVSIVIIVISLVAIQPSLQPSLPPSNGTAQPTPSNTPQTTPQSTIQPTPQNTPQSTPASAPYSTPQNTPNPTQQPNLTPSNCTIQEAIGNATSYLDTLTEPYAMLMLNVIYRRFGINEFADSQQIYDQALASSSGANASLLRVFRRITSYENTLQAGDMTAVTADTDKITVPALYCDQFGLEEEYPELLAQATDRKGYMLTHVLLATIWMQENNYQPHLSSGFLEGICQDTDDLIGNDPVVTDLELEAAAFLYLAGKGSMVDSVFIQKVVEAQNVDGGWCDPYVSLDSNWHSSVLALLLLLHVQNPAGAYPSMLAQPMQ